MAMALDEKARRRPQFDADRVHFVTLADGQQWGIIRPHWRMEPTFKGLKCLSYKRRFGYGRDVEDLIALMGGDDVGDPTVISCVATIAALLLKAYYTLSEPELDTLLCFKADDSASVAWVREVANVITYQESTLPCPTS